MTAMTQLLLYNGALRLLGERRIETLSENREPRRVLDDAWAEGEVDYCLRLGQWNFAIRTTRIDYSPSITPEFGLAYGFDKPSDWIRTTALCSDEYFSSPLLGAPDESGYWFSDTTEIYVKYVSNDASYGGDLSKWPVNFSKMVMAHLAMEVAPKISDTRTEDMMKLFKQRKLEAKSTDAMDNSTEIPRGRSMWVNARGSGQNDDRWNGRWN